MKQFVRFNIRVLVVGGLFCLQSCTVGYSVLSHADSDMPAQAHHLTHVKTHWSYLWGIISKNDPWPADCVTGSNMSRIKVTTNPGFVIISLLSLGIVVPQHLEWDCSQVVRPIGPAIGN
jgi:hypothetical protein